MGDVHDEVRALRAALLVVVQKRFCHGSDIEKKGLNGFYYAAYHPNHHHKAPPSRPTISSIVLAVIMPSAPWQPIRSYGGILCCVCRRERERQGEGEGEKDEE
jgi:hypothetical protein